MIAHAVLLCSHERCAAVYEAVGSAEELDALACECGYGLDLLGWPDELPKLPNGPPLELAVIVP